MNTKKNWMFILLQILAWIIFVGVCIEAAGFLSTTIITFFKPESAQYLWKQIDLSAVYNRDHGEFFVLSTYIIIVAVLRAIMFYLIIKVLYEKKLTLSQPFNKITERFISIVAYLALGIGLFSYWGVKYAEWLATKGITIPDTQNLRLGGADVWLFMSVTLFVIVQVFKRGIEIQTENDLTV